MVRTPRSRKHWAGQPAGLVGADDQDVTGAQAIWRTPPYPPGRPSSTSASCAIAARAGYVSPGRRSWCNDWSLPN